MASRASDGSSPQQALTAAALQQLSDTLPHAMLCGAPALRCSTVGMPAVASGGGYG